MYFYEKNIYKMIKKLKMYINFEKFLKLYLNKFRLKKLIFIMIFK